MAQSEDLTIIDLRHNKGHIHRFDKMATMRLPVSRYRLPSEDDDVFPSPKQFHPACNKSAMSCSGDRGVKRCRLPSEDDDDVFFRPRARLDSDYTSQFPRARLPSDSDTSCSVLYPSRVRRPRAGESRPLLLPPSRLCSSSSVQLNSSQYTADDSPDPAFKTPIYRPRSRRPRLSSDGSSLFPNSSGSKFLSNPPRITRAPVGWTSPSISPLPDDSTADFCFRLQHQISSRSSLSDSCFSPPEQTWTPATSSPTTQMSTRVPASSFLTKQTPSPTSSSSREEVPENLARSILSEELRSDSGISSLPSFDAGQVCFSKYRETFEEKLLDVMVNILNTVDPLPAQDLPPVICCLAQESRPDKSAIILPSLTDCFTDCVPAVPSQMTEPSSQPEISPHLIQSSEDRFCVLDFSSSYDAFLAPTPAPSSASDDSQSPALTGPSRLFTSASDDSRSLAHSVFAKTMTTPSSRSTQCTVCHKVLASTTNLRTHMRIHTGERPFVCPFCFKDFNDRTAWRRHKRLHTGKPFVCSHCPRAFVTKSMLKEHVERHHTY